MAQNDRLVMRYKMLNVSLCVRVSFVARALVPSAASPACSSPPLRRPRAPLYPLRRPRARPLRCVARALVPLAASLTRSSP